MPGNSMRERPLIETADRHALDAAASLRLHWQEYLMEAGESGIYLFTACAVATALWHPASPVQRYVSSDAMRRILMGVSAVVVSLVVAGAAEAGKGSKGSSGSSYKSSSYSTTTYKVVTSYPTTIKVAGPYNNYVKSYGIQYKNFVYFKSANCKFYSTKCYLTKYGCNCFWCPCYECYYYFCVPDDCYYPVTYCPYKRFSW